MVFVTGQAFSGKKEWVCSWMGWDEECFERSAVWDVQKMAAEHEDLEELALMLSAHPVVIAQEVGGGIVPADPGERLFRERAGKLACLLAQRAQTVVRVCCGIAQVLKGTLPADGSGIRDVPEAGGACRTDGGSGR